MVSRKKVKLIALKLLQLSKLDRRWIFSQLPKNISQDIHKELDVLLSLGLDNPNEIIVQLERSLNEADGSNEYQLISTNVEKFSTAECYLYCKNLSVLEKENFLSLLTTAKKSDVERFAKNKEVSLSPSFSDLFSSLLVSRIGDGL